jgi:ferredoxin hydrogenase small subunit
MNKSLKESFKTTRRGFLKSLSIGISMMIVGYRAAAESYSEVKDYLTARIQAVYRRDKEMTYRKSQDNPAVKKLYKNYLKHPMSHESEKLLHATYVDRSGSLKK